MFTTEVPGLPADSPEKFWGYIDQSRLMLLCSRTAWPYLTALSDSLGLHQRLGEINADNAPAEKRNALCRN